MNDLETMQQAMEPESHKDCDVYAKYQENISKAYQLKVGILQGLQRGENLAELFLQACKVIGLMSGNEAFAQEAENNLRTLYGNVFREPGSVELEMEAIQNRLNMLEQARLRSSGADQTRIETAIRLHQAKLEPLLAARSNQ